MQLVLRKAATGEVLRLSQAKVLCRNSRRLALFAPYTGHWEFYAFTTPESLPIHYNQRLAPPRCTVAVGDLLDLGDLRLVIESVEVEPGAFAPETDQPYPCDIRIAGESAIRVTRDLLIGYDPCCGLCLRPTTNLKPLTALLTFATGRWHLHDLNGKALVRNGKAAGTSLVLADGDRVLLHGKELLFNVWNPAAVGERTAPLNQADETTAVDQPQACKETAKMPSLPSRNDDPVYRKAKELCQQLLIALQQPGRKFSLRQAPRGGILNWFRLFRVPNGSAETLDRLHFLLSRSPRDRVWLFELARFCYRNSYHCLCLRVLKELGRLYPHDVVVAQALARFYFQQGRNLRLPTPGRLSAFEYAERSTQLALRLTPNDASLAELAQAVRTEQKLLKSRRAEMSPCDSPISEPQRAVGRIR